MSFLQALVLGIVEGLTEFLPISSTGHLILVSYLMEIKADASHQAFEIIIQGGAMLAVIWHYRSLMQSLLMGLVRGENESIRSTIFLVIAFFPAAVVGLMAHAWIKSALFGPLPVISALAVGGIVMIFIERSLQRRQSSFLYSSEQSSLKVLTPMKAFLIGCFQCLAMWPGSSRSMVTIIGGRLVGLSPTQAAEFSFLLAIPTLLGATAFDLYKSGPALLENMLSELFVGLVASFIVSLLVIKALLAFLRSRSLEVFGWYRVLVALVMGYILFREEIHALF